MNLKNVSPFALKLAFLVIAIVLDHFGMLSSALASMLVTAIGGTALAGAVQAFKAAPAPTVTSLSPALIADLKSALAALEPPAQPTLPGVKS